MHERDAAAPFSFNFIVFLFLWAIIVAFRGTLNSDTGHGHDSTFSTTRNIFFGHRDETLTGPAVNEQTWNLNAKQRSQWSTNLKVQSGC